MRNHRKVTGPATTRPGTVMRVRIAIHLGRADAAMHEAWIKATQTQPGAASADVKDIRARRRSPWNAQLAGIAETLERAAVIGAEHVRVTCDQLITIADVYRRFTIETADEQLARLARDEEQDSPPPTAPAAKRVA